MKTYFSARILFFLSFCLFSATTIAQKGVPFISNYKLPSTMSNQNWSIIQSDDHLVYVLNRKGIYTFDGFEWTKLNVSGKPIAIFSFNNLFVSSDSEIGYFTKDQKGDYKYKTVKDSTLDIYYKFLKVENDLYVSGTQHISKLVMGTEMYTEPIYVETDSTQMITDCFDLNGIIYIIKNKNSVFRLDDKNSNRQPLNLQKGETIKFTFNHNNYSYIGTSSNRLFLFNGWQFKPIALKNQNYFDASYLNGGISIDSNRFVLSTLIGGCSIINSSTYATESVVNYSSGLPDDEIFSMGVDYSGGLWVAHGMGISRIDLNIPVRSYEHYTGISGNILSIAEFNRQIYVGSSEGLYNLTQVKNFTEIEVPAVKPIQAKPEVQTSTTQDKSAKDAKTQTQDNDSKKKKKGFFARLFSKSDKAESQSADLSSAQGKEVNKAELNAAKKKIQALQSVTDIYQKVQGVDGKCKQLLVFNGKLLAATSTGLYEVAYGKVSQIIKGSYILFVKPSDVNTKTLFICSTEGISTLTLFGDQWQNQKVYSLENEYPMSLVELADNSLIVTTEFNVYSISIVQGGEGISKKLNTPEIQLESPVARKIMGVVKVYTTNKILTYDQTKNVLVDDGVTTSDVGLNTIYSQNDYSWVNIGSKWNLYTSDKAINVDATNYLGLFQNINDIFITSNNELLVVNDNNQITKISSTKSSQLSTTDFSLFLKQVTDNKGSKLDLKEIKLSYSNNALNISLGAPFYVKEKSVEFQYKIEGLRNDWSNWSNNPAINLPYFPSGTYTIKIKARDVLGRESSIYSLPFTIKPPIWQTFWFIGLCVMIIVFLFIQIVRYRERQLQKEKQILEQKVQERTKTIEEQKQVLEVQRDELARTNEEIMQQKEEIEAQRDEIGAQRDHISKQNLEMTQSIEYAKRIQNAVMPKTEEIDAILPEHFILFKPRDIVSGDFYWMTERNNKIIVAAADCTGHGVPGAFMSMLGISFLNEIVNERNETKPSLILNHLRDSIKSTLSQTGKEGESKDGMDIALCTIDLEAKKIEFAGAYNPLYLVRNGELIETKGDKMPVGIHMVEKESFTHNEMNFEKNDCIYLFSDGYVSQFGGEDGRTYKSVPFKKMLAIISEKPMEKQCQMLDEEFVEWQGHNHQVDDILVIGIKFT
jgi:serine phosphatase RsbU (regulator of sigma subunit)/ligand-binding sensor domain-containing protein